MIKVNWIFKFLIFILKTTFLSNWYKYELQYNVLSGCDLDKKKRKKRENWEHPLRRKFHQALGGVYPAFPRAPVWRSCSVQPPPLHLHPSMPFFSPEALLYLPTTIGAAAPVVVAVATLLLPPGVQRPRRQQRQSRRFSVHFVYIARCRVVSTDVFPYTSFFVTSLKVFSVSLIFLLFFSFISTLFLTFHLNA